MIQRPVERVLEEALRELRRANSSGSSAPPSSSNVVFLDTPSSDSCSARESIRKRLRNIWLHFLFRKSASMRVSKVWSLSIWIPVQISLVILIIFGPMILPNGFQATQVSSTFCAPVGDHRTISLADGTTVDLNTGTCVTTLFSRKERLLRLETGEALFQVTHDPRSPFIVQTGRVSITDVGTRFDVYRTALSTRVAVFEGAVQIIPRGMTSHQNGIPIAAGQEIDISDGIAKAIPVRSLAPGELDRMIAWVQGEIVFDDRPLREILAEIGRYHKISFMANDPEILSRHFSGIIRTNEVDGFLRSLSTLCIHGEYDAAGQRVTLTHNSGKHCDAVDP